MSNDMKVIMENWDRFVLLENQTLEKIKNSEVETKKLIQQISKVKDKQQLQNFLNIVSQDEEIVDLISSFKKMKEIAEKEKVDEGVADDLLSLQQAAGAHARTFFDTDLGKKIATYGPMTAAIAYIAFQLLPGGEGLQLDMLQDASEILVKGKRMTASDALGIMAGDAGAALAEDQP
jgi:hypothetical protein